MARAQPILLLGLLGGLLGAGLWLLSEDSAPATSADASPGVAEVPPATPASTETLKGAEIRQPGASLADGGPPTGAVDATSKTAAPRAKEPALGAWLRSKLPDRYGDLSDEELLALTDLDLRSADLTDADLARLRELPNLQHLSLYGNPITDAGLVQLASLTKLETVILRGTQVTGVGLQHLPTQNLTALHLCSSAITAEDLAHTPVMPKLEKLKLNFMGFEDGVIEQLHVYPALKHIELDQAKISDQGLARLLELNPGLERVEIRNTPVSAEAIAALQEIYPNCDFATQ